MDMTQIDEQWVDIPYSVQRHDAIVAISNTGKILKYDGKTQTMKLRKTIRRGEKLIYAYHLIAEHFLITVKRPDQTIIDHITHNPTDYNVNDVRNLRWCTHKENLNFDEAKINGYLNKPRLYGDKNPSWKGDNAGAGAHYRRALKLYNAGKITEEEFQPYRDAWTKCCHHRKIAKKTSDPI